jgi:signal transduction histidine kinase
MSYLVQLSSALAAAAALWMLYELATACWLLRVLRRGARAPRIPPGLIGALLYQGQLRREKLERRHRRLSTILTATRTLGRALPDALVVLDAQQHIVWANAQAVALFALANEPTDKPSKGPSANAEAPWPLGVASQVSPNMQHGKQVSPNMQHGKQVSPSRRHGRQVRGRAISDFFGYDARDNRTLEWLATNSSEPLIDVPCPQDASVRLSLKLVPFLADHRLLIGRDITAAMRIAQVRRDFVANVSHELRTPLTVINGYLDTFEPDDIPAYSDVIAAMRQQSQRMVQIVQDLLTLARLDHTTAPADDDVAVAPLLVSIVSDARNLSRAVSDAQLGATQVELGAHTFTVLDSLPMDLTGNEHDLRSAFSNVLTNAVRYTPAQGNITVRWAWHSEGAQFVVQDSGVGIPPQHLPRLTERFYRVSTSRSRETGGTGLGLAIVNHVLQAHGGRLEIESVLGSGSTFRCILPHKRLRYRTPS